MHRQLKLSAKKALCGNWGKAVAAFIIPVAVRLFISLLESLLSLVTGYPLPGELLESGTGSLYGISPWTVAISLGGAVACFVLITPLEIGIKRWYFRLPGKISKSADVSEKLAASNAVRTDDTITFEPVKPEEGIMEQNTTCVPDGFSIDELFSNSGIGKKEMPETADDLTENAQDSCQIPDTNAVEPQVLAEDGYSGSVGDMFDFFARSGDYFASLWLRLSISLRSIGWMVLFSLPGCLLLGVQLWMMGIFADGGMTDASGMIMDERYLVLLPAFGLMLFGWLFGAVFLLRYAAAEYIWADSRGESSVSVRNAIKLSVKAMHGKKLQFAVGMLSFCGWGLLGILILPLLYISPYFESYKAEFIRSVLEENC